MTALHLRIADFKFTKNFIICDRLLDTEIIFGIDIQKKFSISYAWDKAKIATYKKVDNSSHTPETVNKATIGIVKLTLKFWPRHNGIVPIKITGQAIKEHMAYFNTDEDSTKGKDPNINIINDILNIKGKTSVNILISNYTNKHFTFNKGEYIRCLEPAIGDSATSDIPSHAQPDTHSTNSVTNQRMMAEQVELNTFHPPYHKLKLSIESKPDALLKEYASQFAKDGTSRGMTPLTEMMIDTGTSEPLSQKPYPIAMKNYQWVKYAIEKLLTAKVICSSRSSWSVPIMIVPRGDGGRQLVIDYHALNKVTQKFTWPMPKVKDIFFQTKWCKIFFNLGFITWYYHIPLDKSSIPKMVFNSPAGKYE